MRINKILIPILPLVASASLPILVACSKPETITFEDDTWKNVGLYANEGIQALKDHYGLDTFLGLEREVEVFGVNHKVRVIGEDEDVISKDGEATLKRAALTFQFSTILSQKDEDGDEIVPIEMSFIEEPDDDCTQERWKSSDVFAWLNDETTEKSFKSQLKTAIGSDVLKTVKKNSISNLVWPQQSTSSNDETIFLLSLGDIYSASRNQLPDEEQYDQYYKNEANHVAGGWKTYSYFAKNIRYDFDYQTPVTCLTLSDPNGQNHPWWLRTGYTSQTEIEISEEETYVYYGQWAIGADGACATWFLDNPYPMEYGSIGLAPCFCI